MKRLILAATLLLAPRLLPAQERGAAALGKLVQGLGVSARVLVIGAHPDDEDNALLAWLVNREHAETAYLSLTRGDGGQNLIGPELGEALGVIRTEELLAARRVDGAHQFFARAYDFGFSKSADEAFRHWPHDSLLNDIVTVVRTFRPHVIVSIFSGTPRDGHGQHQVAGILAREAYDAAMDTARFPVARFGGAWTPLKFYRAAGFAQESATLAFNVGEYDPLLGQSYYELAMRSRSQHKSQGEGRLQLKGARMDYLAREATRVNARTDAKQEKSPFDGIDTTLARLRPLLADASRPYGSGSASLAKGSSAVSYLDSLTAAVAQAQSALSPTRPEAAVVSLDRVARLAETVSPVIACDQLEAPPCSGRNADLAESLRSIADRATSAAFLARGVAIEAAAERDLVAAGDSVPVRVSVFNRGRRPLSLGAAAVTGTFIAQANVGAERSAAEVIAPDSAAQWSAVVHSRSVREARESPWLIEPWWLTEPRIGDLFRIPCSRERAIEARRCDYSLLLDPGTGAPAQADVLLTGESKRQRPISVPVVYRYADRVRGDVSRPLAVVPAVSVALDRTTELARANAPFDRDVRVTLRSGVTTTREVTVALRTPRGLAPDSASRTVTLPGAGAVRTVSFRVRGRIAAGTYAISAVATSGGETFARGYVPIEYEHIRPQKLYRDASTTLQTVDVRLPPRLNVAYVVGAGDNSAPMLEELGVPVTVLDPARLASVDLARFSAVVVGTRAYESSPELAANNARLLDYARAGGTLVVQYGQYEMQRPGIMPFPITLVRPAVRVTNERSPMQFLQPGARVLNHPNKITARDFDGWVQDRTIYMPSTFDPHYAAPLATNDPGEPPNAGAILVAPYGRGTYVYTTLAFFRQLPAGVPGAARLFVNLLAAGAK